MGQPGSCRKGRAEKSTGSSGLDRPAQVVDVPPKTRSRDHSLMPMPSLLSARSASAGADGLSRPLSSTATRSPLSASSTASVMPAGPEPTMQTSYSRGAEAPSWPKSRIMRSTAARTQVLLDQRLDHRTRQARGVVAVVGLAQHERALEDQRVGVGEGA